MSTRFHIGNGILLPTLFSRYIRDLLAELANLQVGCNLGGLFVNVLAYADDLVLAPSWSALQQLLTAFEQHIDIDNIDMLCNAKKSVCMIFEPRERSKIMSVCAMGFHPAKFGLPRPFHSRVRSRHVTDRHRRPFYNAAFPTGWGHKSLTLIPWQSGKPLSWDVTLICLLANSYVEPCQEAGLAAELAAIRKLAKYSAIWAQYDFQSVAIETLGPLNESACEWAVLL